MIKLTSKYYIEKGQLGLDKIIIKGAREHIKDEENAELSTFCR